MLLTGGNEAQVNAGGFGLLDRLNGGLNLGIPGRGRLSRCDGSQSKGHLGID